MKSRLVILLVFLFGILKAENTGSLNPTATGEVYNEAFSPTLAYTSNNNWCEFIGTNSQDFYNYNITNEIPDGSEIIGIALLIEGSTNADGQNEVIEIKLSWNGGFSWTSVEQQTFNTQADVVITFGGATELWGRTWTKSEFSNANFRVFMQRVSGSSNFYDDYNPVIIYYTNASYNPIAGRDMRVFANNVEMKVLVNNVLNYVRVPYHTSIPSGSFTIYNSWDFENNVLGTYDEDSLLKYFPADGVVVAPNGLIVNEVINGETTKVMQATHIANQLWWGSQAVSFLTNEHDVYQEVYMSYNMKFDEEWNSTAGGKLSGLRGMPAWESADCPFSGEGFYLAPMFLRAGKIMSYHYDRTLPPYRDGTSCPWGFTTYLFDSVYFNNGQWYNVTQRLVNNTYTDGVPNPDAINEIWVDGRLVYQQSTLTLTENEGKGIDGMFVGNYYGGDDDTYKPMYDVNVWLDNITIWMPGSDPITGNEVHNPNTILSTPVSIIDKTVYRDQLITIEGALSNSEYGSGEYSPCIDEAYLIDAGLGNTVTYTVNWEITGGDYLFFYDGNTSDSRLIKMVVGYDNSSNQVITSTGRYLFVRFSTDRNYNDTDGFIGIIEFN